MENRDETFRYSYSAEQQAEVEKIRNKYVKPQEDKLEQLRRLDRSVYKKAQTWAIAVGVIGTLILGTGMSLFMTELSMLLGEFSMVVGVIVGVVGLLLVALAYPVYNRMLHAERQQIAPEILRLTEELMQ